MQDDKSSSGQQRWSMGLEPLPGIALDWLREVIHTEFVEAPRTSRRVHPDEGIGPDSSPLPYNRVAAAERADRPVLVDPFGVAERYARGEVQNALWFRDWHQRWRRFQRPDEIHRFLVQLSQAHSPKAIYETLTEHAVRIVGGYTCLLFPPQEEHPLRPVPNPALRGDTERLSLPIPLEHTGLIARDQVLDRAGTHFASLAPLFDEERAVSVAHAPFGVGGVILLVERRHERVFGREDWDLLRLLSAHACAALARVHLELQTDLSPRVHPVSALLDEPQLVPALQHALRIAGRGEPVTLLGVRLDNLALVVAEDGPSAADRIRRTASEVLREMAGALGVAVRRTDDEFALILPRLTPSRAEGIGARLARQLPGRVRVRAESVAADSPGTSPAGLLGRLDAALAAAGDRPFDTCGR